MKTELVVTDLLDPLDWPGERRLFLGILPDAANALQLAALLPHIAAPAKPVAARNLHLTLLFLGQSTAMQARQLTEALTRLQLPAFAVMLDQWLVWPGPAVLCLAGDVVDPALAELYSTLCEVAAAIGFAPPQHDLKPHITVARHSKYLPALPLLRMQLHASALVLFHSESTQAGVCYRPLWQWPLR
ncbi:RNA 2',3'-cyclic phosphodiesterase [Rheinheimera riviphila]|uniref:RNA 2',3'-cyclic phosphodiesterase n=1 Tax=Rheinheimera riviphila TaxID=1834037 RepID=A0A437QZP6_9GAMM|nr:RNA 2',3'-cyclic phosphodiesterase [Rheinheimera riviphila]RVU39941.1 RNA 2',3'-cyclic phosphodiesterase [Rheinheimera riviphila]